jgi:hypothetical protein
MRNTVVEILLLVSVLASMLGVVYNNEVVLAASIALSSALLLIQLVGRR